MASLNLTKTRAAVLAVLLSSVAAPLRAQGSPWPETPTAAATPAAAPEPALRRWIEFQFLTLYSRYRYVRNSSDTTTASHLQYKDSVRMRFNVDAKKRYTINLGLFSGSSFTSSWDNYGVGVGGAYTTYQYVKQLYASATPVTGLEVQGGGLYVVRGEHDEFDTYDDDGYLVGGRVSLRRPAQIYVDEVSITRGTIGPYETPDVTKRWRGLRHPNYWQVLVDKKFNQHVAGSVDYTTQSGARTIAAAVTLRFGPKAPIQTARFEQYRRVTGHTGTGFVVWAERQFAARFRLQGGYGTIDGFYGSVDGHNPPREWNADRFQRGRRVFALANMPLHGPLGMSIYATHALESGFTVPVHDRLDVVLQYDLLDTLRRTGIF